MDIESIKAEFNKSIKETILQMDMVIGHSPKVCRLVIIDAEYKQMAAKANEYCKAHGIKRDGKLYYRGYLLVSQTQASTEPPQPPQPQGDQDGKQSAIEKES